MAKKPSVNQTKLSLKAVHAVLLNKLGQLNDRIEKIQEEFSENHQKHNQQLLQLDAVVRNHSNRINIMDNSMLRLEARKRSQDAIDNDGHTYVSRLTWHDHFDKEGLAYQFNQLCDAERDRLLEDMSRVLKCWISHAGGYLLLTQSDWPRAYVPKENPEVPLEEILNKYFPTIAVARVDVGSAKECRETKVIIFAR